MRLTHFFAIISAAFMAAVSGSLIADEPVSDENSCYVDGLSDRLRCGYITVAENPQKPNGRRIQIHFVVIPAIKNIYPDQAFLAISGGPGQSAIDQARVFERAFGKVRQQRDILLIDQRGTGRSNILECNEDEIISPLEFAYEEIASADEIQACLDSMDADVSQYGSETALADFEAVRRHLGYTTLHVYGVSYGSRMAQLYMRHFPEVLATVTLDGVVPMQQSVLAVGLAVDRGLELLIRDCEGTPACHSQFPQLRDRFAQLDSRLAEGPIRTEVFHPMTGERTPFVLTRDKFLGALRMSMYAQNIRQLLPLAIDQAAVKNYQPLLGLFSLTMEGIGLAMGMHNSVVCGEDIHRLSDTMLQQMADSYISSLLVDSMSAACDQWPIESVGEAFSAPIVSALPTLLLSGALDPATPPDWADMAMVDMTNAVHLVATDATHGVAMQSCAGDLIADLVEQSSWQNLDSSCLKEGVRGGFYLNASSVEIATEIPSVQEEPQP
mgnify:FL=1